MIDDPIVEEIRRYRQQHAEPFSHDLKRIVDDLRKKEKISGLPRLNPGPKQVPRDGTPLRTKP